jgi:hypothetical protein
MEAVADSAVTRTLNEKCAESGRVTTFTAGVGVCVEVSA